LVEDLEEGWRELDQFRPVEQRAVELGIGDQQRRKQPAAAAADIRDAGGRRRRSESLDDRAGMIEGLAGQVGLEVAALLVVLAPPIPNARAEGLVESGLSRLQTGEKIGPRLPILLDHDPELLVEAGGRIGAERPAAGREREAAIGQLLADADAGE